MRFGWLEMIVAIAFLLWGRYAQRALQILAVLIVIGVCAMVYYGYKTACPGHGPFDAPYVKCRDFW